MRMQLEVEFEDGKKDTVQINMADMVKIPSHTSNLSNCEARAGDEDKSPALARMVIPLKARPEG